MLVTASIQATSVFKILNPKFNIQLNMHGNLVEAALLTFAYNPLPEGSFGPRRDDPTKMEAAKKINHWQELPIIKSKKLWEGRTFPEFVVLVEQVKEGKFRYAGGVVLVWKGGLRIQGEPDFGLTRVGVLSGEVRNGVYEIAGMADQSEDRLDRLEIPKVEIYVATGEEEEDLPAPVPVETSAEYMGDKFTKDEATGHFIGEDGFRVPLNFEEFWERYPHYITNWVKRRLHKHVIDQEVEDWEMDLLMHMKWLPERSKHRLPGANGRANGCSDVVETFNPILQYGASEKRFRNYINNCLANRFNTIMSKRSKNPICRPGNYSLAAQMDPENYEVVDDEYVHANSELLSHHAHREMKTHDDRMFINEFMRFLEEHDPAMVAVAHSISITGTFGESQRDLGMTEQDFSRARNRLKALRDAFLNDSEVPKQRRPYRTRRTVPEVTEQGVD